MSSTLEQTEKTADRIRTELLSTLGEIDRRRRRATDVRYQVATHLPLLLAAGAVLAGVVAVSVGVRRVRAHSRRTIGLRDRLEAFIRAWEHPKRVATRANDRPLPAELLKKIALIFAGAFASRLARVSSRRVIHA
jgi:hypothetical protein